MPILYSFAEDQHCIIKSQRLHGTWNLKLLLPLSRTAQQQLLDLLQVLADTPMPTGAPGDSRLMINSGKPPSTKYFYKLFNDRGVIWEQVIPHRH
jgi:hypothetical protein